MKIFVISAEFLSKVRWKTAGEGVAAWRRVKVEGKLVQQTHIFLAMWVCTEKLRECKLYYVLKTFFFCLVQENVLSGKTSRERSASFHLAAEINQLGVDWRGITKMSKSKSPFHPLWRLQKPDKSLSFIDSKNLQPGDENFPLPSFFFRLRSFFRFRKTAEKKNPSRFKCCQRNERNF